ncbi:MAG: glycosyltransferase family 4 protein [Phycisphaerales bacterium]|nr:glycosyltransferase family 4 protein [Phycisphaerales bacterium]
MRILWHMPTLRRHACGLSNRAMRLANELRKFGHEISFAVADDKTDVDDNSIGDMALLKLSLTRLNPLHWSLQSRERMRAARLTVRGLGDDHDLFISCQPEVVRAYCQRHRRCPVLFVCGGTTLLHDATDAARQQSMSPLRRLPYSLDRYLKHRNEAGAFKAADATVFDSLHTRESVITAYRVTPEKCITVHGGFDPETFRPPNRDERNRTRLKLGLGRDDDITLVWTGRISPEKNLTLLIRALSKCRQRPQRVLIVGEGPGREELAVLCRRESVDDIVSFVGEKADVRPYLHAADIFVFPSLGESFGSSLVEAMGCGLPCIALRSENAAGIRNASEEILGSEGAGALVSTNDPRALAEVIDDLGYDAQRRRDMGLQASKRAVTKFSWTSGGRHLHELILRLCSRSQMNSVEPEIPARQAAII